MIEKYLDYIQENFIIKKSKINGRGCFPSRSFKKGDFINYHFTPNGITKFGRFLNHSNNPTAISKKGNNGYDKVYALKDINPKDEITLDYKERPDLEQAQESWK